MNWQSPPAMRKQLLIAAGMLLSASTALAQQPVQPLPKVGGCPLGYYSSGGYCVPSSEDNTHEQTLKELTSSLLVKRIYEVGC